MVSETAKLWMSAVLVGFLIDCLLGDPPRLPHPIVLIGKAIAALEKRLRKAFPTTPEGERTAGRVLVVCMMLGSFLIPGAVLRLCWWVSRWLFFAVCCVMSWQIFAAKCLKQEAEKVRAKLDAGDLPGARSQVSMLVGRDTAELTEVQVAKAAVETVAENTSDGVIAPLIYTALAGPALGMLYKAINTMDSMIGYDNERYRYYGRAAAKLDDIVNFIPSRMSAVLMIAACMVLSLFDSVYDPGASIRIWRRDRLNHKSPNSAQTESACAGALRIKRGGDSYYGGVRVSKPYIGDNNKNIENEDIKRANRLMFLSEAILMLITVYIMIQIM